MFCSLSSVSISGKSRRSICSPTPSGDCHACTKDSFIAGEDRSGLQIEFPDAKRRRKQSLHNPDAYWCPHCSKGSLDCHHLVEPLDLPYTLNHW